MKRLILLGCIATALTGAISTGRAETIFGLSTVNSIFSFDSATPGTATAAITISGVTGGATITDIDFSPVAGTLYGIATNGDLYRIDTTTGAATLTIGVGAQIAPNTITAPTVMDFNPAADRIRIFEGSSNFRLTGDATTFDSAQTAGTVSIDGTFSGVGGANLVAAAYTNNFNGTGSTTLYSLNTTGGNSLVIHSGLTFSTIAEVGALGVNIGTTNVGFDISALQGAATGFVSDDDNFYTVDLATGAATLVGVIGNGALTTQSIAASTVPEPTVAALGAIGLLGLLARRRRNA
jgi:MYXO-CTERM domain-containing protein